MTNFSGKVFSSITKLPPVKCESHKFLFGFFLAALMPFSSSLFVYKSAFEAKCLHVQKYMLSILNLYLSLKCSTKKNLLLSSVFLSDTCVKQLGQLVHFIEYSICKVSRAYCVYYDHYNEF